jgi:flavin-binding protein dodecin
MSVARVTEITSTSESSFDDAIRAGLARAGKTLRNVKSAWVKEQQVRVGDDGGIVEYQVNLLVTFVLDD